MPVTSRSISSNIFGFVSSFYTIPGEISSATKVINLLWKDDKYSAVVRALDGALPIPEGPAVHPSTSITVIPESQPVTVKDEPTEDKPAINQATEEPVSIPETQTSGLNEVASIPETENAIEELNSLLDKTPTTIGKGRPLDMALYKDFIPEVVDKIPHNIDGLHHYMIDCREDENSLDWQKRYRDGR